MRKLLSWHCSVRRAALAACLAWSAWGVLAAPLPETGGRAMKLTSSLTAVETPPGLPPGLAGSPVLRAYRTVRVGYVLDSYVPVYLNRAGDLFEGVLADYLAVMGAMSGLRFEVYGFADAALARRALESGAIDLLAGTANDASDTLMATSGYLSQRQVEVRRTGAGRQAGVQTIAIARGSIASADFTRHYAEARVVAFPTQLLALEAVAFGRADLFVGMETGANFLIDQMQLLPLSIANFAPFSEAPFVLLALPRQARLLQCIDTLLRNVPVRTAGRIHQRWLGAASHFHIAQRVNLSPEEQAWIQAHPRVRFGAARFLAPFSFLEQRDAGVTGMSMDLLSLISARTGLRFEPVILEQDSDGFAALASGRIDLLLSVTETVERRRQMLFSSPYMQSLWVIVTRADQTGISSLADLAGRHVGVPGNIIGARAMLPESVHESARLVAAPDMLELFRWLQEGKVEAIATNLFTANFLIATRFGDTLKVVASTGDSPWPIGFAADLRSPELIGIIDKVLDSIPPEEIDAIRRDWSGARVAIPRYGLTDRQTETLLKALLSALALLCACGLYLAWSFHARRQQAQRLRDQLEFQRTLINGLPFSVFVRDAEGRLVSCNAHYAAAYGDTVERLLELGRHETWEQTLSAGALGTQMATLARTVGTQHAACLTDCHLLHNGEPIDLFVWMLPVFNADREFAGVLGGWLDITERKRSERELQHARQAADAANRAKNTFLATISHEIRTPMHAILGTLELEIRSQAAPDKRRLGVVQQAAQSLLTLINDILDYAKIEAGQLSLDPQPADPREELERLLAIYRPLAREKALALETHIADALPPALRIDALRVRQIVGNLLSNALKFTRRGMVGLDVQWRAEGPAGGTLRIVVRDTGTGIRAEHQARLFLPFRQAGDDAGGKSGGTGLGLWICRQLLAQMGGRIWMRSEYGKGTEMFVEIPAQVAAAPAPQPASPQPAPAPDAARAGLRVLVVDDHPANQQLLMRQLAFFGVERVRTAAHGEAALAMLAQADFDLVVTDCNMPGMDGYALARRIRADARLRHLRIIGCTADARPEVQAQAKAAGMDACIVKPVSLDTLRQLLPGDAGEGLGDVGDVGGSDGGKPVADLAAQRLGEIFDSDRDAAAEFLRLLQSTSREYLADVERAVAGTRLPQAASSVHKLKGGVAIIGFTPGVAACEALEQALRAESGDDVARHLAALRQACADLDRMLGAMLRQAGADMTDPGDPKPRAPGGPERQDTPEEGGLA